MSRSERRPRAELRLFSVREPIPRFRLPLRLGDAEPEVDLGSVLGELYDLAAYDLSVDYREQPTPRSRPTTPPGPIACCGGPGGAEPLA